MATGPALNISIAEKGFPGAARPLFTDFHLAIAPSTTMALIGSSGIGKSTLLRMIAGIDGNFTGTITIDGIRAEEAQTPGFVFQDPRLLPWLTAADNIRAANPQCSAAQTSSALDQVGLAAAGDLYPHQLSGGMQRRVALARALAVNASLLLLDEPFVSLDRALVDEMQHLLLRIVQQSRPTVVFVSHLADDAARLADRVILLDHRPAAVLADISLPVPPAERDATTLDRYRDILNARMGTTNL